MIIYKENKGFEQKSDKPNENWTNNNNVYIVDDESELAQKIINAYPYYDFIENAEGNLVDVVALEKPSPQAIEPTIEDRLQAVEQAMIELLL